MNDQTNTPGSDKEVAHASDVEQQSGHGGNLRDGPSQPEAPMRKPVVGNSGHIPQLEEIVPPEELDQSASPGADADRDAAQS